MRSNLLVLTLLMKLELKTVLPIHWQTILLQKKEKKRGGKKKKKKQTRAPAHRYLGSKKLLLQKHHVWVAEKARAGLKTTSSPAQFSPTSLVPLFPGPAGNRGLLQQCPWHVPAEKPGRCLWTSAHIELLSQAGPEETGALPSRAG